MQTYKKLSILFGCGASLVAGLALAQDIDTSNSPKVKAEVIPGFVRHNSLPQPARGIKFAISESDVAKVANSDVALAFVLSTISKTSEVMFTGTGGGKAYVPADAPSLRAFHKQPIHTVQDDIKRSPVLTEWQYSAKFDDNLTVVGLNVMLRSRSRDGKSVLDQSTRVYEVSVEGNNEALRIANAVKKL
jgi:hypothetical protein